MEVTRRTTLTDKMALHYFELPKLPKVANIDADDELELWLSAINAKTEEQLSTIKTKGGEVMELLVEAYHNVAASPELREQIRQRERAKHNEASALANAAAKAERKGLKKGRTEGREEGRAETLQKNVRHMYQEGLSVEMIVKYLDLSVYEVKKFLKRK